jgi:fatty-acid desaturase
MSANCPIANDFNYRITREQKNQALKHLVDRFNAGGKPAGRWSRAFTLGFIADRAGNRRTIRWSIVFALGVFLPVMSAVAIVYALTTPTNPWTWVTAVVLYMLTNLGVTMYYHRLLTHRGYKVARWVEYVLATLAAMSWQGTARIWVTDHRKHHAYADVIGLDPHSPWEYPGWRGLLWAQWLWLFFKVERSGREPRDLAENKVVAWQRKPYGYALFSALSLLIPWLMFGLEGLLIAGFLRIAVHMTITGFINSICHMWGTRTKDSKGREFVADDSRNNLFVAIVSMGEGNHNGHHSAEQSVHHGYTPALDEESRLAGIKPDRRWKPDFTYRAIQLLAWLNLAWDVKVPATIVYFPNRALVRSKALQAIHEIDGKPEPSLVP